MSLQVLSPTGWKSAGTAPDWTRPADWLPTSVAVGEQKAQLLLLLGADPTVESNRVMSLSVSGSYTVNWGDGTAAQDFTSGAVAQHLYDTSGLTSTSEGYKQALLTITPRAGQNLTNVNLSSVYYASKTWRSPVVEIVYGSSVTTALTLTQACPSLRRVEFKQPFTTTLAGSLFLGCSQLREVVGEMVFNTTACSSIFSGCSLLTKFPKITIVPASGVNASSMFAFCFSMVEPPPLITSPGAILTMTSMFNGCYNMKRVPAGFSIAGCNTLGTTFQNCGSLEKLPLLDTSAVTVMTSTFLGCTALREVSFTDLSKVTTMTTCFSGCASLESLTNQDWSAVTPAAGLTGILTGCFRLAVLKFLPGKGPLFSWTLIGQIDGPGLNAIYTALPVTSGQTVGVSGVGGGITDDPTIATAKGWTVTGT